MAARITTYEQAFDLICVPFNDRMKSFVARMEREGHTEKSIAFAVWRKQDKLLAFKGDSRFMSILGNEINKWSWKKDDPRWQEYWNRKNEEKKAVAIRREIDVVQKAEYALELLDKHDKLPKRQKPKGYVYFIQGQCGGAIKIGYSLCPEKRLRELQTGYPDTLMILLMIPGTESTEAALHRQFESSRLKGEWFRPDSALIDAIKELKSKHDYSRDIAAKG